MDLQVSRATKAEVIHSTCSELDKDCCFNSTIRWAKQHWNADLHYNMISISHKNRHYHAYLILCQLTLWRMSFLPPLFLGWLQKSIQIAKNVRFLVHISDYESEDWVSWLWLLVSHNSSVILILLENHYLNTFFSIYGWKRKLIIVMMVQLNELALALKKGANF